MTNKRQHSTGEEELQEEIENIQGVERTEIGSFEIMDADDYTVAGKSSVIIYLEDGHQQETVTKLREEYGAKEKEEDGYYYINL